MTLMTVVPSLANYMAVCPIYAHQITQKQGDTAGPDFVELDQA